MEEPHILRRSNAFHLLGADIPLLLSLHLQVGCTRQIPDEGRI